MRPFPLRFAFAHLALAGVACALVACGHPATEAECDEIFNKVVELELSGQKVNNPDIVSKRSAEAREARGAALRQRCLGRRLTDKAMSCVRGATSYDQIENECFR
ncbi:MAG TPA: hypothetical protein VFS00_24625 [Polyangiaceae bacterium]|nr:hypothetical protein [Polyangiaceae bacterium]